VSKKIYLNKSDSVTSAIEKVIGADDNDVVLYIPRDAQAGESKKNLELIKREADAAGKNLLVESVDDNILSRLNEVGIKSLNPFLGRGKKTVSDIVKIKPGKSISPKVDEEAEEVEEEEEEVEGATKKKRKTKKTKKARSTKKGGGMRRLAILALSGVILALVLFGAVVFLPKASISIALEKMEHGFIGNLIASPEIEESRLEANTIYLRGVALSGEKNLTKSYPATGEDSVGRKAKGIITVYNNFNTSPQTLVETTRFVTPEGKIYRADRDITVPGGKMVDGDLVPSSINVPVTADQPGEEYNIGPVDIFRIPGFQGSSRYEGFYGLSSAAMTGGYTGEVKVPTEDDINVARKDLSKALEELIKTEFLINLPDGIEILDEGQDVEITKEQVNNVVDEQGNFSITLYGSLSLVGFNADELVSVFEGYFEEEAGKDLAIYDYSTEFGAVEVDGDGVSAAISFDSTWVNPFNKEEFKEKIRGMTENQLRQEIFASGAKSGEIRMSPFWVNRVPQRNSRITIDVD